MIIGVTGSYASGKDSVAEILKKMNFYHLSFSDILREELTERKQKITRDALISIGNELREKHGPAVLAKKALEKLKDGENFVFTSLRNPKEVELLQKRKDFLLINVTAPDQVRLTRLLSRNREEDPRTIKELREKEALENSTNPNAQQLQIVAKMAQVTVRNDSTIQKLEEKMERLVSDYLFKLQDERPGWDEYFMNIALQVKTRSTCMSAKKGAIIVKDKRIITTGYNGTPAGIVHCNQGGCIRCTQRHLGKIKSGSYSEPCICSHSEENAIVQAAYIGVATKGATMYSTFTPCVSCAKLIINAGIIKVVMKAKYPDDVGIKLLQDARIELIHIENK